MITIGQSKLGPEFEHVYSGDPAIESSVEAFDDIASKVRDTGDVSLYTIRKGERPTVWKLRRLDGIALERVRQSLTVNEGEATLADLFEACEMSLMGGDVEAEGIAQGERFPRQYDARRRIQVVAPHVMASLQTVHNGALVYELGLVAIKRSLADPLS
jgi:hypothetical protein